MWVKGGREGPLSLVRRDQLSVAENASLPMCNVGQFYACYDEVFCKW